MPLIVLLLLLAAVAGSSPPGISVAELQSATVRPPTGGGRVWVLGRGFDPASLCDGEPQGGDGAATLSGVEVQLADAVGAAIPGYGAPLAIEQSLGDSLLLVNLGRKLPPQALRLRLARVGGGGVIVTTLSPLVNTAEPHWVSPFVRPGGTAFLVGRRFWSSAATKIVLSAADGVRLSLPAFVESDTRVTFAITNVMPGEYSVSYHDDWGACITGIAP